MALLPSSAVQRMFPTKIASLDELSAYAEGRDVAPAGAALACPVAGFIYSPSAATGEAGGGAAAPGSAAAAAGGGAPSTFKRSTMGVSGRLGGPTTARGFSGMAPAASGSALVKSTLAKKEEDDGGARVQIDHVVVMGSGPDDACNAFEANPFKPESAWRAEPPRPRARASAAHLFAYMCLTPFSFHATLRAVCKRCRKMRTKHI